MKTCEIHETPKYLIQNIRILFHGGAYLISSPPMKSFQYSSISLAYKSINCM